MVFDGVSESSLEGSRKVLGFHKRFQGSSKGFDDRSMFFMRSMSI